MIQIKGHGNDHQFKKAPGCQKFSVPLPNKKERELCGGCEYQVLIGYKRLTLYTLTSACIFSILFSVYFHRG